MRPLFETFGYGIVIQSEAFDLMHSYATFYIDKNRALIEEYLKVPQTAQSDQVVTDMQEMIEQAQQFVEEVSQLRQEAQTIYRNNFFRYANVFRSTRIDLGIERIQDMYPLQVALDYAMKSLKGESAKFSRERFVEYINNPEKVVSGNNQLAPRRIVSS